MRTMESAPEWIYNAGMLNSNNPRSLSSVERDPRLFIGFLTLVMGIMYAVSLVERPALREPLPLAVFTILFIVHVLLHWQIEKIFEKPALLIVYILVQGGLGFAISWMAAHEAVTFAIFMALFGEAIGLFGLTRRSLLAAVYYLGLAFISLQVVIIPIPPTSLAVTTLPVLLFVVIFVTLYNRQSAARVQAQALAVELKAANHQLSEYAAQIEDLTIAGERQRLARELHDTLSQGLAGLILQLEAADAHLSQSRPEKARRIIDEAMQKARETLADSRRAIGNLRENNLVELRQALRREVERFQAATGIPCSFHADQIPSLPDPLTETILRIASEALTNVARHAQASEASVTLSMKSPVTENFPGEGEVGSLIASISDNGIGFDPQKIPPGHYGLLGIRERMRILGGTLVVESTPQRGTVLSVEIPIPETMSMMAETT